MTYPKLTTLEVENAKCSYKHLDHFIQRHKKSLSCLRIIHPRMTSDDFTKLKEQYLRVEGMQTYISEERLVISAE